MMDVSNMSKEERISIISDVLEAKSYRFFSDSEDGVMFLRIQGYNNEPPTLYRMTYDDQEKLRSVIGYE